MNYAHESIKPNILPPRTFRMLIWALYLFLILSSFLHIYMVVSAIPPKENAPVPSQMAVLQQAQDIICQLDGETCEIAKDADLKIIIWDYVFPYGRVPGMASALDTNQRAIYLSDHLFDNLPQLLAIYYHELQHVKESNVPYSITDKTVAQCVDHNRVRSIAREFIKQVDGLVESGSLQQSSYGKGIAAYSDDYGNRIEDCNDYL